MSGLQLGLALKHNASDRSCGLCTTPNGALGLDINQRGRKALSIADMSWNILLRASVREEHLDHMTS